MRALLDDPGRSGQEPEARRSLQPLRRSGRQSGDRMKKLDLSPRDWGLVVAASALILDQGTKLLMLYAFDFISMGQHDSIPVLPFFNLVMVWNPGVSYGLFPASSPMGSAMLALFSVVAVAALSWWLWLSTRLTLTVGLGLVIGGALGNLIDRLGPGKGGGFFPFFVLGHDV